MMRQYRRIRDGLPADVLLFFRLGDFYELFGPDAVDASALLRLTLTKRGEVPMCGVPFHAADNYVNRLLRAGRRVAVCDQKGEVKPGVLVEREVSRIVSAGTVTDGGLLDASRNHYLAAAHADRKTGAVGFAHLDLTTGQFRATELPALPALLDELARLSPAEFLVADDPAQVAAFADLAAPQPYDAGAFAADAAGHGLREHFRVQSLDGFGLTALPRATAAAGAILHYLKHTLRRGLEHVTRLSTYRADGFLALDAVSQAHLEILKPRTEHGTSLLQTLDRTVTPLGARRLRSWLAYPLRDVGKLLLRQGFIAAFLARPETLRGVRETLKPIRDLERAIGRLSQRAGNARDLLALQQSLAAIPELRRLLAELPGDECQISNFQSQILRHLHELPDLAARLSAALADELPSSLRDGGIFRDGFHPELDELRAAERGGKDWIAALQEREIQRTGIQSLKIRYNSVFGYYIEITKSNLPRVPADYHRKQTTANGERFVTPELKEVESRILGAEERARQLEYELFGTLRDEVLTHVRPLQETANAVATLDALASLAEVARLGNYCRPTLREDNGPIRITGGRHPVLDAHLEGGRFVPNDVLLDADAHRLLLITGPNMAGKSTYLRQTALLVLLAQVGSYLPATAAEITLVDRIFTRVGASDDLGRGQSTFLVEMNETAHILHHATAQSLVILDEIGRGTSTYDGLSIAWSVAEHLHDVIGARTLFATHYHELTELARTHAGVQNLTVAVREWNDEIVFLHRIVPGAADKSYGIQVARLAGLPATVVERAKSILARLEASEVPAEDAPKAASAVETRRRRAAEAAAAREGADGDRPQMTLF